ncbi:SRPBCC family protein [Blastococcus sp. SYSU D00820]
MDGNEQDGAVRLREDVVVDRPAAVVWALVADYGRDPEWRAGVVTMAPSTAGPVVPGTTTAEVLRFGGRTLRNAGEVLTVDPGRRFTWRTTSGAPARGARTVEPLDERRCRVTCELTVTPRGAERLFRRPLAALLRRTLAGDVARLKALAEAGTAVATG